MGIPTGLGRKDRSSGDPPPLALRPLTVNTDLLPLSNPDFRGKLASET
jgi:hypothetical protein